MPVTAGASGSVAGAGGASATSLFTTIGVGAGGILIAVALIFVLGYLNLLNASERDVKRLRMLCIATAIPLSVTFGAIVTFEALAVL